MRHLKTFESLLPNLETGEIAILKNYAALSDGLYLILEDTTNKSSGEMIRSFFIGTISKNAYGKIYACLIFNRKNGIVGVRNTTLEKLNDDQKDLVYTSFTEQIYKPYINITKEKTGIDITQNPDYQKWLIEQSANKYNI